jgi:hypothetical protein
VDQRHDRVEDDVQEHGADAPHHGQKPLHDRTSRGVTVWHFF